MIATLLISAWAAWIFQDTGIVTGTLKTELGTPAVGVRVGAMARPESSETAAAGTAFASIAETDAAGRFRLENIPPGRYYITAGRVDFPTFYPGSQLMSAGTAILVKTGETVSGIDFKMSSAAVRPPAFTVDGINNVIVTLMVNFPINIHVAGGGAVPVYSDKGFASIQLTRTTDGAVTTLPLAATINVPIQTTALVAPEYRIAMLNLPEGFAASGQLAFVKASTTPLTITLAYTPPPAATNGGVRVSGRAPTAELRSIYMNGIPGIFFSDGSFEFRNVQPGRYSIATPDNPQSSLPLAASIVVGDQDLNGVQLAATPLLPTGVRTPAPGEPAEGRTPGASVPPGVVRGLIVDAESHQPLTAGMVFLTGVYGVSRELAPDGRFEFTRLLPGTYKMEIQAFAHATIQRTIVIGDEAVQLEVPMEAQ